MKLEDLYLEYGDEFLEEQNPDEVPQEMKDLVNFLGDNALGAFALGMFAYAFFGGSFNTRASYFVVDAAGNVASIEDHQLLKYYNRVIDDRYFIDWLYESEIIDDSEYKMLQYAISL